MKKFRKALFAASSIMLVFTLVGCSKKTDKTNPTTKPIITTPVEKVLVEFDSNGGSSVSSQSVEKGGYATKPTDPTREGYTFNGWFYEESKFVFDAFAISKDLKLTAKWSINSYNVTLSKNIDAAGTISGEGVYEYNSEVALTVITIDEGYTFDGWYIDAERIETNTTYEFIMPSANVDVEARWVANKYHIAFSNNIDVEDVSIELSPNPLDSNNTYEYGTAVTLTASDVPAGYIVKWELQGSDEPYYGNTYSVTIPSSDINLSASLTKIYSRSDKKLYFGYYPQTLVTKATIKSELNTLADTLPTSENSYKWTDYGYYMDGSIASYMWYIDLDTDKDGRFDYRGVYFTDYRKMFTGENLQADKTYQDDNNYNTGTVYWFKYEIIEWNIIKEEYGKAMLVANLLLDSQDFYPSSSNSSFSHNGEYGYANNYELSNIRKWLNDNFYNTAFNTLEKDIIQITSVDNSAESAAIDNDYICGDTEDKVFLLSTQEVSFIHSTIGSEIIKATGSDYAKAQGLCVKDNGYSNWSLRSPSGIAYNINNVDYTGLFYGYNVFNTFYGVRPALWIEL